MVCIDFVVASPADAFELSHYRHCIRIATVYRIRSRIITISYGSSIVFIVMVLIVGLVMFNR